MIIMNDLDVAELFVELRTLGTDWTSTEGKKTEGKKAISGYDQV